MEIRKNILIMFGGQSSEHEVSVISGLQILENIDKDLFNPIVIYITKKGEFKYVKDLLTRKEFLSKKHISVHFEKRERNAYLACDNNPFFKALKIDSAYLAFHGGNGEIGPVQGLLETFEIPYTSPSYESSTICMNKAITKEIFTSKKLPTLPYLSINSIDCDNELDTVVDNIIKGVGLPAVVKAVHIGSTIGVMTAKTEIDLKKALLILSKLDRELLVEKMLINFTEYNISVRKIENNIETSVIEKPVKHDELLSFKDKYQTGSKSKSSGMASLDREIPAKIDTDFAEKITEIAKKAYQTMRCSGTVRIDFMFDLDSKSLYITEINTIPGSLAFYLWEASGVPFRDQITASIDQSFVEQKHKDLLKFQYESDIVEKFVKGI
jgi:D-alanine-D-alanine ligase